MACRETELAATELWYVVVVVVIVVTPFVGRVYTLLVWEWISGCEGAVSGRGGVAVGDVVDLKADKCSDHQSVGSVSDARCV